MPDDTTIEFSKKAYKFEATSDTSPCLVMTSGPDAGAIFALKEGETIVGRCRQKADIVLTEPGISRAHATFLVKDGVVAVKDLGSTNGLHLNGEPIDIIPDLRPGDNLTLSPSATLKLSLQDDQVQRVMADLYQKATIDGSTGVLTKESFFSRVEVKNEASLGILDVDHLESVTDRHGHLAGEQMLSQLAATLKNGLADKGYVGRLSGETFIIFLHCRALDADDALEGVRKGIEYSNFRVDTPKGPQFLRATVSIGVADLFDSSDVNQSIAGAEKALLSAKQMGRNRINIEQRPR